MVKLVFRLSQIRFVHSAMVGRADLSAFGRRPNLRVISGVSAIALGYVIGWPLMALLGIAAVHMAMPPLWWSAVRWPTGSPI